MKKFEKLPENVKDEIRSWLKVFPRVSVTYENGEYHYGGDCIKKFYSDDYEVIGAYTDKEVFTEEERIVNYAETFHAYPINYKGKTDYKWIRNLSYDAKLKLDEKGNLVLA